MYTYMYTLVYIYIYTHIDMYMYLHMYMHMYMFTYAQYYQEEDVVHRKVAGEMRRLDSMESKEEILVKRAKLATLELEGSDMKNEATMAREVTYKYIHVNINM